MKQLSNQKSGFFKVFTLQETWNGMSMFVHYVQVWVEVAYNMKSLKAVLSPYMLRSTVFFDR
jgi:hypothetical protein